MIKLWKVKREYFPAKISMANISKTSTVTYIFFYLWIPLLIPYQYMLVFWKVNYFETRKPTPLRERNKCDCELKSRETHQWQEENKGTTGTLKCKKKPTSIQRNDYLVDYIYLTWNRTCWEKMVGKARFNDMPNIEQMKEKIVTKLCITIFYY